MPPPFPLGRHAIAEFAGCRGMADPAFVRAALIDAAEAAGATVLDIRAHHFGDGQGVTGVALLAESHISIHTWPEHGEYAAIDVFMCGAADIDAAVERLRAAFAPESDSVTILSRGLPAPNPRSNHSAPLDELAAP